jgi:hypothetical protein
MHGTLVRWKFSNLALLFHLAKALENAMVSVMLASSLFALHFPYLIVRKCPILGISFLLFCETIFLSPELTFGFSYSHLNAHLSKYSSDCLDKRKLFLLKKGSVWLPNRHKREKEHMSKSGSFSSSSGSSSQRCIHGHIAYRCVPCDGPSICEHKRVRRQCKDCKGSSICEHSRQRAQCTICKGSSICGHNKLRNRCKECKLLGVGGQGLCDHFRQRSRCPQCGGVSICEHKKQRSRCKECKSSSSNSKAEEANTSETDIVSEGASRFDDLKIVTDRLTPFHRQRFDDQSSYGLENSMHLPSDPVILSPKRKYVPCDPILLQTPMQMLDDNEEGSPREHVQLPKRRRRRISDIFSESEFS